jgi:hypothetical protein
MRRQVKMAVSLAFSNAPSTDATSPTEIARAALAAAFKARTEAANAHTEARQAVTRARIYLSQEASEVARLIAEQDHIAEAEAAGVSAALKAGRSPSAKPSRDTPEIAAALAHARSRAAAAELASAQLGLDEVAASDDAKAADGVVTQAVRAVVQAHADALADRLDQLRAEESDLVEKVGLHAGWLAMFLNPPPGSALSRGIGANWITNGHEHRRSLAYGERWAAFAAALQEDANAELNLN